MGNTLYLFLTAIFFGLAVNLREFTNVSDTVGAIVAVIGVYFFVVFLYKCFKDDKADKKEASAYRQRMKERELMDKKRKRRR